jgi:membrane protein implicated in regulation of membrane protease activity
MNVFTFVFFTVTVVLCAKLIQTWIERRNKTRSENEADAETLLKIDRLEERIQVLERIVTEDRYDLKKRIDNL